MSERSRLIMTYALCGLANFGGLGVHVRRHGPPWRQSSVAGRSPPWGLVLLHAGALPYLLARMPLGVRSRDSAEGFATMHSYLIHRTQAIRRRLPVLGHDVPRQPAGGSAGVGEPLLAFKAL